MLLRKTGRLLLIASTLAAMSTAGAAELSSYFDSSARGQPRGDAGLALSGEKIRMAADLALRGNDRGTEIVPHLSSAMRLSPRMRLETRFDLTDWNARADLLDARVATQLSVQTPTPFLHELEGDVWRAPDGQTGGRFTLGFRQKLSEGMGSTAITIQGKATFEKVSARSERVALETEVRGLKSSTATGHSALRLRIARSRGAEPDTSRSVAYDRSWKLPSASQLALNVGMLQVERPDVDSVEPTLAVSWRGEF
jgi:hypothetical protein